MMIVNAISILCLIFTIFGHIDKTVHICKGDLSEHDKASAESVHMLFGNSGQIAVIRSVIELFSIYGAYAAINLIVQLV